MRPLVLLAAVLFAGSCKRSDTPREAPSSSSGNGSGSTGTAPATTNAAATDHAEPVTGPHVILRPPAGEPTTVRVEVQANNRTRSSGLMYRRELDEMAGMIFVFPTAEHQVFWMRNTFLPLDMIFITAERRVLGVVRNATPMTDDQREVPGDSQYVLEVRAGFADRHHITPGTRVEMVNVPPAEE